MKEELSNVSDIATPSPQPAASTALQCLAISSEGVIVHAFDRNGLIEQHSRKFDASSSASWSPDGEMLAIVRTASPNIVSIMDANTWETTASFDGECAVVQYYFSPLSNYLMILCAAHPVKRIYSITCWNLHSHEKQFTTSTKLANTNNWLFLQWSQLETICCRLVNNEVWIYNGDVKDLNTPIKRIQCNRAQSVKLSPEVTAGEFSIAVMSPSPKELGKVCIYRYADSSDTDEKNLSTPILSHEIEDAEEMELFWSSNGDAALLKTHTGVDKTGKSYYGLDKLYFISVESALIKGLLPPLKGPVQDVQWSPGRQEFLLCAGPMPPEIVLYNGKTGNPNISYGTARRNTIRWNPFGRFFAVGGFGNLAGELAIWDKVTRKCVGSAKAPCAVVCEFAPDGRHLALATTTPRLRVDNCLKIFRYTGEMISKIDFKELYSVSWRPVKRGVFEDKGKSPNSEPMKHDIGNIPPLTAFSGESGARGALASKMRQERATANTMKVTKIGRQDPQPDAEAPPKDETKVKTGRTRPRKKKTSNEKTAAGSEESAMETATSDPVEADAKEEAPDEENTPEKLRKTIRKLRRKARNLEKAQNTTSDTVDSEEKRLASESIAVQIQELETQLKSIELSN